MTELLIDPAVSSDVECIEVVTPVLTRARHLTLRETVGIQYRRRDSPGQLLQSKQYISAGVEMRCPLQVDLKYAVPCLHASRRGILPPLKLPLSDICVVTARDMAIGVDESCDSKGRCLDATWQDAGWSSAFETEHGGGGTHSPETAG